MWPVYPKFTTRATILLFKKLWSYLPPLFLDGSDSSHLYCSACSLAWRWISFFAIITVLFPKCQCSSPMLFLWPVPAAFWIFWTHCRVELVYSLRLPVCLSSILLLTGTTQENGGVVLVSLSLFPLLSLSLSICASDSLCFFSFLEWWSGISLPISFSNQISFIGINVNATLLLMLTDTVLKTKSRQSITRRQIS